MITLTIRTDKPESEIGLYNGETQLAYETWHAHRQLAETIHAKIESLLMDKELSLDQLEAIAIYKGPGSFTGLRIGMSVANALSDSYSIPIASETGDNWASIAQQRLAVGDNEQVALPEYGALPHITKQKH